MPPETRHSLIQRLQGGGDNAAWEEFASIYRPIIVRIALRKQLQFDDAEDLAQQVLLLVLKNISKWKTDPARARFRTWLQTVVRNATINALSRRPKDQASGGTTSLQRLNQSPDKADSLWFDLEWQRETLRWVAQQIRGEFESTTWTAFWETAIEELPTQEVAERIGKSVGAVYIVHDNVVGIHAISEWQGNPYLVMTFVRGQSLQSRLHHRGHLSLREVLRIGLQISAGLEAAHAQGLIHRDIKPANIMLESDVDRVMITDFGIAKAIDDLRFTGTNTLLGTPEYMSPEQARDEQLDYRTDLFSLGCVLYEASCGRSPFRSTEKTGKPQSHSFKLYKVPVPYGTK